MSRVDSPEEAARLIKGRALPKEDRERGNPFTEGLTDRQRAARLEGRKLLRRSWPLTAADEYESLYRVDLFRRYISNQGREHALVQFYGIRATRKRLDGGKWSEWQTSERVRLHTVEIDGPHGITTVKQK